MYWKLQGYLEEFVNLRRRVVPLKILLTIGARGGSKGVKGKNIRHLLGKPLIVHTISQARRWGKATKVVVSTDSELIAKTAKRYGAEVPFMRPASMATDKSSKIPALIHALKISEKLYKIKFDVLVDLDVTSPVRTMQDLDNCLKMYIQHKPNTIFSVSPAHKNPYFNIIEYNARGVPVRCKRLPKNIQRRQDAPKVYDANASIYFYDRNYLLKAKNPSPLNRRCMIYVMREESGFDIDREIDFKFLEFLVKEKVVQL
jgi:CMP-N,N'-diacetyllegionaminic acid synthase